jgi:hypothetical protein
MSQSKTKPPIEEIIPQYINGEKLTHINEFLDFLKGQKLRTVWKSHDSWQVNYKGKLLLKIYLDENGWYVRHFDSLNLTHWLADADEYITDDNLREYILTRIKLPHCPNCESFPLTIFGKSFERICYHCPFYVDNPANETLEYVKTLTLAKMKIIVDMKTK